MYYHEFTCHLVISSESSKKRYKKLQINTKEILIIYFSCDNSIEIDRKISRIDIQKR